MLAPPTLEQMEAFPGWELVSQGLADVSGGRITPLACLVAIALPRLRRAGLIDDSAGAQCVAEPEKTLYRLLLCESDDAYGRYNAMLRRLIRFEHALDRAAYRRDRAES